MKRHHAKELGLRRYYSDTVCKRGHEAWRYTVSGTCVACKSLYKKGVHSLDRGFWERVEERVHAHDVAAVRDYCRKLREYRASLMGKSPLD